MRAGAAGEQLTQQRMELVDQPHPALSQVHPGLVEQRQGISDTFSCEGTFVALQRSHAGRGRGVDLVILAPAAAGELSYSSGRGRWHVDDLFATGQQPRRQMPSQAFGVLHRPAAMLELPRPPQHPGIVSEAGLNADRGNRLVRTRVHRRCRVRALVRVDTDDHHRDRAPLVCQRLSCRD
jgi:hypothetical protein